MTSAMFLILVIEDDPALRNIVGTLLAANGYRVADASTGERGLIEARSRRPDLVIVDLGLPDRDGATVIREIRLLSPVPILVLSARTMESRKISALDAGADDYVTKPFSTPELLARVRAALRRSARSGDNLPVLQLGPVTVDLNTRTATNANGPLHLTPLEYRVLGCLARNSGMIVTQRRLIAEAWGNERQGDARGLRSYVKTLRQKLEADPGCPRFLITEVGVGYRLRLDEAVTPLPRL
jgi:two-component system, OmpR family, KDP operon response regulator KdpE